MLKYLFIIISLSSSLFSEEKKFDDYDNVEKIFQAYLKVVDEKNVDEIAKYFYYGGGPDRTIFHFGDNPPIIVYELEELKQILTHGKSLQIQIFIERDWIE